MRTVSRRGLVQFLKYNFGGLLYFWCAWAIITFGTESLGSLNAYLIGNLFGMALNYAVQKFWAFSESSKNVARSGWKFIILTIVNIAVGYVLLRGLVGVGIPLWLAQFGNAGFFTLTNWVLYKTWVFKEATHG